MIPARYFSEAFWTAAAAAAPNPENAAPRHAAIRAESQRRRRTLDFRNGVEFPRSRCHLGLRSSDLYIPRIVT